MSGLHFQVRLVYLDDTTVFFKQLISIWNVILKRLRSAGLKLKPEKCVLFQKSVSFLGHVVSDGGIKTNPEKINAVAEWSVPKSLRELRAFLGLAGITGTYFALWFNHNISMLWLNRRTNFI